jgi:hypothetical protein
MLSFPWLWNCANNAADTPEQREWDAIEAAQPGYHTLLHTGIKTEQEAEKLARGRAGDDDLRRARNKTARIGFLFGTRTT